MAAPVKTIKISESCHIMSADDDELVNRKLSYVGIMRDV